MEKKLDVELLKERIQTWIDDIKDNWEGLVDKRYNRGLEDAYSTVLSEIEHLTQLTFQDLPVGLVFQTNRKDTYIKVSSTMAICAIDVSGYNNVGEDICPLPTREVRIVFLEAREEMAAEEEERKREDECKWLAWL
jgi:hypothetical protein